jgi:threonine synthase
MPKLPDAVVSGSRSLSFSDLACELAVPFVGDEIPGETLRALVRETLNFPVPVRRLDERLAVLELFHGPTLAFKDFGARFLARILAYHRRGSDRETTILVATSGDTGSAVASACADVEGLRVVLLYPAGKVSTIQELQLTTGASNILALSVDGTFDDCQNLVKQALADRGLTGRMSLTSANSINIARLIPQIFYYVSAWKEVASEGAGIMFTIPCGNLGNLTAGVMAHGMGVPVCRFLAATNANDVLPEYLQTGVFRPRTAVSTLSNAMDVGNPNNFARLTRLLGGDLGAIRSLVTAEGCTDDQTREAIREAYRKYHYIFDPHGAVGYHVASRFSQELQAGVVNIILATAHPAKFPDAYDEDLLREIPEPEQLSALKGRTRRVVSIRPHPDELRSILLS